MKCLRCFQLVVWKTGKLVVRAERHVERREVLAFCGPYFMNFLVLHVFADVSVELNCVGKHEV